MKAKRPATPSPLPDSLRFNYEAEAATLGACLMMDSDAVDTAMRRLRSDHFHFPTHRQIFEAILQAWQRRQYDAGLVYIEPVTVGNIMRRNGTWDTGTSALLTALVMNCPSSKNINHYVDIVRECARRRALSHLGEATVQAMIRGDESVAIIAALRGALDSIENECRVDWDTAFEAKK